MAKAVPLQQMIAQLISHTRHCEVLNIQVIAADKGKLTLSLPYSDKIIGNPETGVIDGGALTTLMDTTCAFAAVSALSEPGLCPTLDLRIDYMKPATPGIDIIGEAEAYHMSSNVVFARGVAYHEHDKENPIAHCMASFMRIEPKLTQRKS